MLTNTTSHYGLIAIALHWLMAAVIFGMFALGWWMTGLSYYDPWYHRAPELHKAIGMLLFGTLIFRFCWRLWNIRPTLIGLWWEQIVALGVHRLHYLLMFTIMTTGYLIPTAEGVGIDIFGWFSVPAIFSFDQQQADLIGTIHWGSAWMLMGLAALHTAAALKHHIIDKDATLTRMLGLGATNAIPNTIKGDNT